MRLLVAAWPENPSGNANLPTGDHHFAIQQNGIPNIAERAAKMPSKRTKVNLWKSGEVP
jgi:hypothetical protein